MCPILRPYRFGLMRIYECNQKLTGNGYEAVDSCEEAVDKQLCETVSGCEAEVGVKLKISQCTSTGNV